MTANGGAWGNEMLVFFFHTAMSLALNLILRVLCLLLFCFLCVALNPADDCLHIDKVEGGEIYIMHYL